MATITWDETGKRLFEAGVSNTVLYPWDRTKSAYGKGVAWNGVTSIPESPEGAESNGYYADNIKYLNIITEEDFKTSITAYASPEEFDACDGSAEIAKGVYAGQQTRDRFCLCWKTLIGNDTDSTEHGYRLHIAYNCTAAPSEREHSSINESTEPAELSWDITTTKENVPGHKPTAHIYIDSTRCDKDKLTALEEILYGGESTEARCPMPSEIITLMGVVASQQS